MNRQYNMKNGINKSYSAPESASSSLSVSPVHPASSSCAHNFASSDKREMFSAGDVPALRLQILSEYSRVQQKQIGSHCTLEKLVANVTSDSKIAFCPTFEVLEMGQEAVTSCLLIKNPLNKHTC
jgi:hypothetical protein